MVPSYGTTLSQTAQQCVNTIGSTIVDLTYNQSMYNGSVRLLWAAPNYGYFDNTKLVKPTPSQYLKQIFTGQSSQQNYSFNGVSNDYTNISEMFSVFEKNVLDKFETEFLNFSKSVYDYTPGESGNPGTETEKSFKNFQMMFRSLLKIPKVTGDTGSNIVTKIQDSQVGNVTNILRQFLNYDVVFKYGNPSLYDKKLFYTFSSLPLTDPYEWEYYTVMTPNAVPTNGGGVSLITSKTNYPKEWSTLYTYVGFSEIPELVYDDNGSYITDFFIDFVPMYDKFRAVSSIQVLLELCIPVIAIMGLQSFFTKDKELQWTNLWKASATTLGLILVLFLIRSSFDFAGAMDGRLLQMFSSGQDKSFGINFLDALKEDRRSLYSADLLRSGFFIVLVSVVLYLYVKNKLASTSTIVIVGLLMVTDLVLVDKSYVSKKDFVSAREVDIPFELTEIDNQILQDSTHYRVLDIGGYLNAKASYFHKSIGGYSAVRPMRMQELFDYQIAKNNIEVLNMLNVKYIIQTNDKGEEFPVANPDANGNAWFVKELKMVNSADSEMKSLNKLDTKNVAVYQKDQSIKTSIPQTFSKDSATTIKVDLYKPNYLKYTSSNTNNGFAVFSEMYYEKGWKATIDGKDAEILNVNYVLRGLQIPAGKHTIEFKFEPEVVKTGSTIALISTLLMLIAIGLGIFYWRKQHKNLAEIK